MKAEDDKNEVKESIEDDQKIEPIDVDALGVIEEPESINIDVPEESPGLREPFASQMHISEPSGPSQPQESSSREEVDLVIDEREGIAANGNEDVSHRAGNDLARSRQSTPAIASSQVKDSQSSGVFRNAKPSSPASNRKGKRKSTGPPLRKYAADQPAIVILDSMGSARSKTISNLKEYLILEGLDKRDLEVSKDDLQGFHARSGIPQQETFYDCGVYVCGYVDKFMRNPARFGRKLLAQEFTPADWPEMNPGDMRDSMRSMLQDIAKEQNARRTAEKQAKKDAKRKAKLAAGGSADAVSSPPTNFGSSQVHTRDSSPIKPSPRVSRATTPKLTRATTPKLSEAPAPIQVEADYPSTYRQRDFSPLARSRSASPGKTTSRRHFIRPGEDILAQYMLDPERSSAAESSSQRVDGEDERDEGDWVNQLEQFSE
jgi:hypothetical protein